MQSGLSAKTRAFLEERREARQSGPARRLNDDAPSSWSIWRAKVNNHEYPAQAHPFIDPTLEGDFYAASYIPGPEIIAAFDIGPMVGKVFLCCHFKLILFAREGPLTFTNEDLARFGLKREPANKALRKLQEAGFVELDCQRGRHYRFSIAGRQAHRALDPPAWKKYKRQQEVGPERTYDDPMGCGEVTNE